MPTHPHEPVTPMPPMPPPFPPAPPCGCTPPRMRPEPFSPGGLPAPHGFDFGKWAREKIGWLLSLVPSAASEDNQLADKAWVAEQAISGKADKVGGATAGNLAGLDENGNLTDSGKEPADFAGAVHAHTASQITDLGDQLAPKAARTELFPAWAANTAYTTYSLVIHENAIYKCTTAHTSGAEWDSTKWAVASGAEVLAILLNYLALSGKPQINSHTLTGDKTGADLGLLDLTGNQNYTGTVSLPNAAILAGDVATKSAFDFIDSEGTTKSIFAPDNTGKALTDADVDTVVLINGQQDIYGYKTFNGGMLVLNGLDVYDRYIYVEVNGILATFGPEGITVGVDLSDKHFDWPTVGGTLALLQNLAPNFSTSSTYALNSLCVYNSVLYRCTTAITTAENWTPAHWTEAKVEDILAALRTGKADVSAIPYDLGTPVVINTASSETIEGETVYYGAATLANRAANFVQVTAATALDELRITFPAATSGKVRDFGLRVEIGTGSAALAAPALVPIAPSGETIKIENNAKEIPALADGTATAKGVTLLYFSENAPGVFVVKGEQVEEVA